jgi:pantoate--beta-alanine ligase
MREIATIADLRHALAAARKAGRRVGFVPTMGYLHDGHVSLMEHAAAECDEVLVSIFVNPLQFGANEDLDRYPRDLDGDRARCQGAGVTMLFVPAVDEMYPRPVATTVSIAGVSQRYEGASRPTHFAGVATVVAKLFNLSGPCRAYFGEKDFQQIAVVRRMVADLSIPVDVVACPTVREPDGLAMSSRNAYLDPQQRAAAPVLHRALVEGVERILAGERDAGNVVAAMASMVDVEPLAALDYLAVVDPDTLDPVDDLAALGGRPVRLLGAIRVGATRLIDNVGATVPEIGRA